jgi:hypothetical protein
MILINLPIRFQVVNNDSSVMAGIHMLPFLGGTAFGRQWPYKHPVLCRLANGIARNYCRRIHICTQKPLITSPHSVQLYYLTRVWTINHDTRQRCDQSFPVWLPSNLRRGIWNLPYMYHNDDGISKRLRHRWYVLPISSSQAATNASQPPHKAQSAKCVSSAAA